MKHELRLKLRAPDGSTFAGRLEGTWHESEEVRLGLAFAADEAPVLPLGSWVRISLSGGPLEMPIEVSGEITFRHQDGASHVYHFRFDERARRQLGPLVEPRQAMRVQPAAGETVEVALLRGPGELPLTGALKDLSVTGGSVVFLESFEGSLFDRDRLELELRLPGDPGSVRLTGLVRNRGLVGGSLVYGFEFDAAPRATLAPIVAFVERRLKAIARARRADEELSA